MWGVPARSRLPRLRVRWRIADEASAGPNALAPPLTVPSAAIILYSTIEVPRGHLPRIAASLNKS